MNCSRPEDFPPAPRLSSPGRSASRQPSSRRWHALSGPGRRRGRRRPEPRRRIWQRAVVPACALDARHGGRAMRSSGCSSGASRRRRGMVCLTDFAIHGRTELHRAVCLGRPASGYRVGHAWDRMNGLTWNCSGGGHRAHRNRPESATYLLCDRTSLFDALLVQASLALGKRLSTHPALRASTSAGGEPCPLSLVANQVYRAALRHSV